ncbi:hypothetical protein KKG83_05800 [Candidatus Micrarchaeota archaeon]|nr:hypothetical protein [Candidatus Micrarchaeota archaeon]MBU2476958.1 hypothetical protein [Candidatus Micrarchaeota archaeon]
MIKAQASVELLIILAVSMIALGLIFAASNNEITGINSAKANSDAKNTVEKIAGTAKEVYVSGQGTKKQIFILIPSGVDESKSSVSDKTIRLNVNGTDLIAETTVEVTGSIPTTAGGHWIWITAYPGYVFIGDIEVETNKGSIYSTITQETSAIENIKVINNTTGNATVNVSVGWSATEVSLSLSENGFIVPADSSYGIDLNFTSSSTAVGNYTGELIFDITTVDGTKQIIVPVTIEVIIGTGGQPLMIFPEAWNASVDAGTTDSNTFQACNTTSATLTNIVFTASSGDAGDWVETIPSIISLAGNTCQQITVTIDVPGGASSDTGIVTASDGTNSDFISLTVSISSMADNFNFDWSTAFFASNTLLEDWTIENASSSAVITIARMQVLDWNENDLDNANLNRIRFNGTNYWTGNANAGDWLDVTDFTINPLVSFSANNQLRFTSNVRDDGEYFRITFEFTDGSTYTTDTYYSSDIVPPIVILESPSKGYVSADFTVQFDYNVNDVDSGIAFCELIIDGIVDQTDNTITEGITQSFSKTFSVNGTYYWDVNCTDDSVSANKGSSTENRRIVINSIVPTVIASHYFNDTLPSSGTGWLYPWTLRNGTRIVFGNAYTGSYSLRLRSGDDYAERAVDLSAYSNVKLGLWAKTQSFEGIEEAYIMVSPDHTHWTTIKTFVNGEDDNIYRFYEFDLDAYGLTNEFWIRFEAGMTQTNDYLYIDDITVITTP